MKATAKMDPKTVIGKVRTVDRTIECRIVQKDFVLKMIEEKRARPVLDAERVIRFVASTESVDRDGDVVSQNWVLDNFKANPVILLNHNQEKPLGRSIREEILTDPNDEDVKRLGPHLAIYVEFMGKQHGSYIDETFNQYKDGFLKAGSVGYVPIEVDEVLDEERRKTLGLGPDGLHFTKSELAEFSLCTVPSNPNALRTEMKSTEPVVAKTAPKPITKSRILVEYNRSNTDEETALEWLKDNVDDADDISPSGPGSIALTFSDDAGLDIDAIAAQIKEEYPDCADVEVEKSAKPVTKSAANVEFRDFMIDLQDLEIPDDEDDLLNAYNACVDAAGAEDALELAQSLDELVEEADALGLDKLSNQAGSILKDLTEIIDEDDEDGSDKSKKVPVTKNDLATAPDGAQTTETEPEPLDTEPDDSPDFAAAGASITVLEAIADALSSHDDPDVKALGARVLQEAEALEVALGIEPEEGSDVDGDGKLEAEDGLPTTGSARPPLNTLGLAKVLASSGLYEKLMKVEKNLRA